MEPGKLSFIPKKSAKTSFKTTYKEAGLGLLMKVSVFLFVLAVAGHGSAYFYKKATAREIENLSTSLEHAKSAFDASLISEMEKLMVSLSFAGELLDNHPYPSSVFDALEKITHENVSFRSFVFGQNRAQEEGSLTIYLSGVAESYRVLAEQALVFENRDIVRYFSFSNFSSDEEGEVTFSLVLSLDPSILFVN